MQKHIGWYREGISVSTENSPVFDFQLVNIPLTLKHRSKTKDCIDIQIESHGLYSSLVSLIHALDQTLCRQIPPLPGWNPKLFPQRELELSWILRLSF